jgi:two-component system, cell cycle sensor histidine kinase and response regulator CckA
VQRIA